MLSSKLHQPLAEAISLLSSHELFGIPVKPGASVEWDDTLAISIRHIGCRLRSTAWYSGSDSEEQRRTQDCSALKHYSRSSKHIRIVAGE